MRLKVLPLPAYVPLMVKRHELLPDGCAVTYNRDGFYMIGGICWIEYAGKAYVRDTSEFLIELRILNAPQYRKNEYDALCLLRTAKRLPKNMLEQLADFEMWQQSYGLPMLIASQRVKKRFREFCQKRGLNHEKLSKASQ
jgi:hypothetical protein